jgi:hypothetical protein
VCVSIQPRIRVLERCVCPLHLKDLSSHFASNSFSHFPQDCDFPEDALLPEIRPESHTEINVMEFLNIKRADGSSKLNP